MELARGAKGKANPAVIGMRRGPIFHEPLSPKLKGINLRRETRPRLGGNIKIFCIHKTYVWGLSGWGRKIAVNTSR